MKPVYVFVYGTLKRGYANNYILATSELVGPGSTVARCRLFHAGFPVLRPCVKGKSIHAHYVRGEVYKVTDPNVLARLDGLESEGHMYHRKVKLIKMAFGKTVKAFTYVGDGKFWTERRVLRYELDQLGEYSWPARPLVYDGTY